MTAAFIEGAFEDAERQTPVEVALVYLHKQADMAKDVIGDLLTGLREDSETGAGLVGGYQEMQALALPNSYVENSVVAFKAAVQAARDAVFAEARAGYYESLLGETMGEKDSDYSGRTVKAKVGVSWVQEELAKRYKTLKERAWTQVLRSTDLTSRLSSAAKQRVEAEFQHIRKLEFSVSNVMAFLLGIVERQGDIQREMVCDVFDSIGKYHTENLCYFKGWRSNDRQRLCGMRIRTTRFILPGFSGYSTGLNYESEMRLKDFDKVFAMLDGKAAPEFGLADAFRTHWNELRCGARVETSYFDVRYYPGASTVHFFARSRTLVDRLNRMVGRYRQWIPPETTPVSDGFWAQFDKAEKWDKEVRAAVARKSGSRYRSPLDDLTSGSPEAVEAAQALLDGVLMEILEEQGIDLDFRIKHKPEDGPVGQLSLLAA